MFWLLLESSTINSRKLPHYGPKRIIAKGDTVFYSVPDTFYTVADSSELVPTRLDDAAYPLYAAVFINKKYRDDAYRLTGLWEYLNYKKDKVEHIPFVIVTEFENGGSLVYNELKKLSDSKNVHFYYWPASSYDSLTKVYFKEKPYYIDYSFFLLVDARRNIRGYYDARYVSEMKRLIEEYKHLRIKEEKQRLTESNEIKTNS